MLKGFKKFVLRGNVVEMAVGIIIGLAFNKIINSFVNDILMPPISLLVGKINFSNLYINLSQREFANMAEAEAAGVPIIKYGVFINTVIDFLLMAFFLYLVITYYNKLKEMKKEEEIAKAPDTKQCPYCYSTINIKATRCPNCTAELE
ncbi:MAG TPA: large conductance mechanosensitive channel protein MscL [Halanaerobiales bacterium]|nr:large conductance mechanosensitive channel protein MscL [Halanaerobiales bacterium]